MQFVEGILAGLSASDAYRAAYNVANSKPETIWCNASKLRHDTNVAQWLEAARTAGLERSQVALDSHLSELSRLKELAIQTGNLGAAVQAEQLRGKASGHYSENVNFNATTEATAQELINAVLELPNEILQSLAQAILSRNTQGMTAQ